MSGASPKGGSGGGSGGIKKRRHPRVDMEIPAEVFEPLSTGGRKKHDATIGNLGPDGAFVKSDVKTEQGGKLVLAFKIPSHALPFEIDTEVRWARDGADGGIGLQFTTCPTYDRAAIDDYCQVRLEEARGPGGGGGD